MKAETKCSEVSQFGEAFQDGRLCVIGKDKPFKAREAFLMSKRLGRPLTREESKKFEY